MKKIILLLLLAIIGAAGAQAQIVRSESLTRTVVKKEKPGVDFGQNWLVKAGGGVLTTNVECSTSVFAKYSVMLGYQKQFYKNGLYWGGQFGLIATGYDELYDTDSYGESDKGASCPALAIGPTLGLKRPLGVNTVFDTHIGAGYAHAFTSDDYGTDDSNRLFWEVGFGIWYKRYLIEIEYQGSVYSVIDNGVLLNFGIKF